MLAAVMAGAPPSSALARPMGYAGSNMAMADLREGRIEAGVNHAWTPADALGIAAVRLRGPGTQYSEHLEAGYTRLLVRRNAPDAQSNLWLSAGLGALRERTHAPAAASVPAHGHGGAPALAAAPQVVRTTRPAVSLGLKGDWETTRLYAAAGARLVRARGMRHDHGSVQAGFAFTDARYDAVQPWLILEARRSTGDGRAELTAMVRLIHRSFRADAGVNDDGRPRLNINYIF